MKVQAAAGSRCKRERPVRRN